MLSGVRSLASGVVGQSLLLRSFPRVSSSVPRFYSTKHSVNLFDPTPEHKALRELVRNFTKTEVEPQALENNRNETFNIGLYRKLGELGLLGVTVDERFGGSGLDAVAACLVHEELSTSDPAFCLSYLAHSMLFVNNLSINGSVEQKQRYLPDACSGKTIGGMCMSEPGAGTDVLGMRTTAVKSGNKYILNGEKMWITNGAINDKETGDVFLVYARTGKETKNLSLFIVEKNFPGFHLGQKIKDKLGMRASATAALYFSDCEVPSENLVGKEGEAVMHMMRNLEIERVTLGAMSVGIARRCLDVMNVYAKQRVAFGQPLNKFGQIQRHIADSYAEYMAAKCYVYNCAGNLDLKSAGNRIDSDGVKLFGTTVAKNAADRAIQVLGGNGYVGEYVVERLWRDAKLLEIGGGTLEAHQKNIAVDLSRFEAVP